MLRIVCAVCMCECKGGRQLSYVLHPFQVFFFLKVPFVVIIRQFLNIETTCTLCFYKATDNTSVWEQSDVYILAAMIMNTVSYLVLPHDLIIIRVRGSVHGDTSGV